MIELILTILAWRKGWGPAALLPMVVGVPVGVMAAAMTGSIGAALVADVAIYITLILMIAVGNKAGAVVKPVNGFGQRLA